MSTGNFEYASMNGKNVLITGGLGFIGSNLAHRCVELGARVTLLDACLEPYGWNPANIEEIRTEVEFVKGDVRDRALLTRLIANQDVVFHLAGQVGREISIEQPELDVEVNCTGTINVLEACRVNGHRPKVVFAGSRGQIGEPITLPVDESHPQNPTDVYGIDKMAAEQYLLLYGKMYDLPVVSLRLNNVYGPRCQMHAGFYGILNWFMANAMTGKPITVYGEGTQTRDYVYISDVVDARSYAWPSRTPPTARSTLWARAWRRCSSTWCVKSSKPWAKGRSCTCRSRRCATRSTSSALW